jgi:hypothetical protein
LNSSCGARFFPIFPPVYLFRLSYLHLGLLQKEKKSFFLFRRAVGYISSFLLAFQKSIHKRLCCLYAVAAAATTRLPLVVRRMFGQGLARPHAERKTSELIAARRFVKTHRKKRETKDFELSRSKKKKVPSDHWSEER